MFQSKLTESVNRRAFQTYVSPWNTGTTDITTVAWLKKLIEILFYDSFIGIIVEMNSDIFFFMHTRLFLRTMLIYSS